MGKSQNVVHNQTAPTSARNAVQSSRNKKLGPSTRWMSSKYLSSLVVYSCNTTHIITHRVTWMRFHNLWEKLLKWIARHEHTMFSIWNLRFTDSLPSGRKNDRKVDQHLKIYSNTWVQEFRTWSWNFTKNCSSNSSSAELPECGCGLASLIGNDSEVIGDSLRLVLAEDPPQLVFARGTEKWDTHLHLERQQLLGLE